MAAETTVSSSRDWRVMVMASVALVLLLVEASTFLRAPTSSEHLGGPLRGGTQAPHAPLRQQAPRPLLLPVARNRETMIRELCQQDTALVHVVELGVQRGGFAEQILGACSTISDYVGIDLWAHQEHYDDGANVDIAQQLEFKADTERRLSKYPGRWRLIQGDGIVEAAKFANASLDLVYLDARHDYKSVWEDIRAWRPKVRPGGVLAGHDFLDAHEPGAVGNGWRLYRDGSVSHPDKAVRGAVMEWAESEGRQVVATYADVFDGIVTFPSWWVRV